MMSDCTDCPRYKEGRCSPVGPLLPGTTPLMAVLDMPDREDMKASLLSGGSRAGLNLGRLLVKSGITRAICRVTSVLKCGFSPDPAPAHIEQCKKWLWGEMRACRPRVILALGSLPCGLLLKDKRKKFSLKEAAGEFFPLPYLPGAELACWYDPHYLFNQGSGLEQKTLAFFREIKRRADVFMENSETAVAGGEEAGARAPNVHRGGPGENLPGLFD